MFSFMHAHPPARASARTSPGDANWLPVTQRGDAVERGADMLADRATATPGARGRRLRPSQSWAAGRAAGAGVVPSAGGRPLEPGVRAGMESSFGHDFSTVRVHSGDEASLMAQRVQARAYAVGHDIVLGAGEAVGGDAGRCLLAHELAHVVQYDLSGRAVLARTTPPTAPPPVAGSSIQYEETPLPGGRVRMRAWGRVGDPVARSGYEGKWPGPGEVGLEGMDRWHLAGPDATGGEMGIAYTPKNFNIGKTATVENVLRNARGYMRAVGGDVYFDFTADCRIVGEHEGVSIRVVEDVHWQIDGRLYGGNNVIQILDEHAVVPTMPPASAPTPSPAQSTQGPGTAGPEPTSTTPTPKSPTAPEGGGGEISTLEPTGGPSGTAVPTPTGATPTAPVEEPVTAGPAASGTGLVVTTLVTLGAGSGDQPLRREAPRSRSARLSEWAGQRVSCRTSRKRSSPCTEAGVTIPRHDPPSKRTLSWCTALASSTSGTARLGPYVRCTSSRRWTISARTLVRHPGTTTRPTLRSIQRSVGHLPRTSGLRGFDPDLAGAAYRRGWWLGPTNPDRRGWWLGPTNPDRRGWWLGPTNPDRHRWVRPMNRDRRGTAAPKRVTLLSRPRRQHQTPLLFPKRLHERRSLRRAAPV